MKRLHRAEAEVQRLRELLGGASDIGEAPPTDQFSPLDEAILARILRDPPALVTASRSGWRRRSRPFTLRLAVSAGAIVTTVLGLLLVQSSETPAVAVTPPMLAYSAGTFDDVVGDRAPSATDALLRLATAAGSHPSEPGSGTQRVQTYGWLLNTVVAADGEKIELAPTRQTTEVTPNGSVRTHESRAAALGLDGRVIDPSREPIGGALSGDSLPAGTLDPAYAATLPRDPGELEEALFEATGGDTCRASDSTRAACAFLGIIDLHARWVVPNDVSASLWAMLATNPAVADLGTTTDRLGRSGTAIAVDSLRGTDQDVLVLVIDAQDGQLLSWEQLTSAPLADMAPGPHVIGFQAIFSATWEAADH